MKVLPLWVQLYRWAGLKASIISPAIYLDACAWPPRGFGLFADLSRHSVCICSWERSWRERVRRTNALFSTNDRDYYITNIIIL